MKKKGTRYLTLLILFISICCCANAGYLKLASGNKNGKKNAVKKPATRLITAFKIPQQIGPESIVNNPAGNYIGIPVHAGTDVTAIAPTTITTSPGNLSVSPGVGVPQDFTNAVGYTIGGLTYYSVNVIQARAPAPICTGTSTTITGDTPPPAGTLRWEILNTATGTWSPAAGTNTTPDYTTATLSSNPNAPKLYTFRRSITIGAFVTWDSYTDLTVNPNTPITSNTINQPSAANSTFCVSGDPGTITGNPLSGGIGTYTYQWQSSVGGNAFADIPGATGSDLPPSTITASTIYRRVVTSGNCTPPTVSNKVTITILNALTNNQVYNPATILFCISAPPTIINGNIPSGGVAGNIKYQWQSAPDGVTFTDIPGSGTKGNDYNTPALTRTTSYRRAATSGACSTPVYSNVVTITIQPGLGNNSISTTGTTTFCTPGGDPGTIGGTLPTGGDGANYTYVWQSSPDGGSFSTITAATGATYSPGTITTTTYYQRLVTSVACSTPLKSTPIVITIQPALANNIITAPPTTAFCTSNGQVPGGGNGLPRGESVPDPKTQLSIKGTNFHPIINDAGVEGTIQGNVPTGGDGTPVYQWESSTDGTNFSPITGATNQIFNLPVITSTTYYRRGVTSGTCTTVLYSNIVTIFIQPALANNTISAPPIVSFCEGGSPGLIQGSVATGGDGNPAYQWASSTDGINFTPITGATGQTYNPGTITQTTTYWRSVTSGTCTTPLVSNPVIITVTPAITSNVINQPPNAVFCVTSSPITISVQPPAGGNGNYTYQWISSIDNTTFNPINSATAADYAVPALTTTTWFKRVVSSGACLNTSQSNPVVITVYQALANNIITSPSVSSFCQSGDAGPITATTPTGGDGNYTYQWQQSPTNAAGSFIDIGGETNTTFDPPNLTSTMFYRRVVMNSICTTPLISNVVTIKITPALTANTITPPITTTFCTSVDPGIIPGGIPVGGDGTGTYIFQWQKSIDNQNTWTDIGGAAGYDYDSPPISVTTSLRRNVISGACTVPFPSNVVTFTIIPSPVAVVVDAVPPICSGNMASISVTSPDASLTYTWYDSPSKTNQLFSGPVYTTLPLNADATFYVEASNGTCSSPTLTSAQVKVINPPGAPVLVKNPVSVCEGAPATLTIANPQSSLLYKWYASSDPDAEAIFTGPELITVPVTNNATYFVVAVNSNECVSAPTTINIIGVAAPQIAAQGASVCPGTRANLTANTNDADAVINWYANATGGDILFTNTTFQTPVITTNTTYYAEAVNSASGCTSVARAPAPVLILQPLPTPVPIVQSVTPSTITFQWAAVNGATGYEVSIDGGKTFSFPGSGITGTTQTVTGLAVGENITLIVHATGDSDCALSSNSLPVTGTTVSATANNIFVANAFTPNGDGKNDVIYVHNENMKSMKFYVYDQWGELLYMTVTPQNGWDGTYKGKAEPAGVYVYYVEIVTNDGQRVNKKGTVTLIR